MAFLTDPQINALLGKAPAQQEKIDVSVSLDEVESFGDSESLREMMVDMKKYRQMLRQKITFINDDLSSVIPFTRENLYLVCAYTGNGKSTIAANISYPLWKQGKKVLVIANEEPRQDVLLRIACLELGQNFNDHKKGFASIEDAKRCAALFPEIAEYVKVLDVNYKGGLTKKLEGIKNALNAVKEGEYSCALIDYYQLIQYSQNDPSRKRYDVLNDLRMYLGEYIKNSDVPVVLFAQLHSMGKRTNKDLDSRVKECPTVLETATVVIEVVPNFDNKTSDFMIHKDRFGMAGKRVTCGFDKGRFVKYDSAFQNNVIGEKLDELTGEKSAADGKFGTLLNGEKM